MRPKRYPYSLTSEILVDTSIIYAWDKPMYKMISFMNRYTGKIRVESFKLWHSRILNTLTGSDLGRLSSTTQSLGELWEIESGIQSVCAVTCVDV